MAHANPDIREKKRIHWIGKSLQNLLTFPQPVRKDIGSALGAAQFGERAGHVKSWKGEGPGVFEIVEQHSGDAFRAVYTAAFERAVYVPHVFQKKSPDGGSRTDKRDVETINQALKAARSHHQRNYEGRQ